MTDPEAIASRPAALRRLLPPVGLYTPSARRFSSDTDGFTRHPVGAPDTFFLAYNGTVQVMGAIAQDQGRVRVRISLVSTRKTPELRLTLAVVTMPVSAGRASL